MEIFMLTLLVSRILRLLLYFWNIIFLLFFTSDIDHALNLQASSCRSLHRDQCCYYNNFAESVTAKIHRYLSK